VLMAKYIIHQPATGAFINRQLGRGPKLGRFIVAIPDDFIAAQRSERSTTMPVYHRAPGQWTPFARAWAMPLSLALAQRNWRPNG